MTGDRIVLDLDLSALDETRLAFAEAIATELRYQAPGFSDALRWTLAHERARRDSGAGGLVLFLMPGTIADAYDGARATVVHSALADLAATREPEHAATWQALSEMFVTIHQAIVAQAGADDIYAYRLSQLSPPNAA
jgi:hypothetical protein